MSLPQDAWSQNESRHWRTNPNVNRDRYSRDHGQRGRGRGRGCRRGQERGDEPTTESSRRMKMENIASVSRSSGLERDGDALKDFKVQEEYRVFIQEKLDDLRTQFPSGKPTNSFGRQRRVELQENILILFRKLREGIISSQRYDHFSLEVYETSLYLSCIFHSPTQTTSIIGHLLPDLYDKIPAPHRNLVPSILISLLHELVGGYPSNAGFQRTLKAIGRLDQSSEAYRWITDLSASLRTRNYTRFETLTRYEAFVQLLSDEGTQMNLKSQAVISLINTLRTKTRETTWSILRSAYRELSCHEESGTRPWLVRSLALGNIDAEQSDKGLDEWLEEKSGLGDAHRKEGVQHRWVLVRVRR
ncbi:hypothetical protein E1B28_012143 [Marasmius oreades]|uniref:Uncharacterized protein n=1 Tax=Marasmius oreades TaxID=181124 RepID=A0A9P7RRL5_9AGAR|nr:uncharacterized protein E1B28_012143 [Marasmius oreades]KAG7088118.1 hypothetical protein E1B28_012143 [Marasmius oreades]